MIQAPEVNDIKVLGAKVIYVFGKKYSFIIGCIISVTLKRSSLQTVWVHFLMEVASDEENHKQSAV